MKKSLFLLSYFLIIFFLKAQNVSFEEADKVAHSFFSSKQKTPSKCTYIEQDEHNVYYYIFNASNSYVVISGDKSCPPILAYSDNTQFVKDEVIDPVSLWLHNYKNQIKIAKEMGEIPSKSVENAWKKLLNRQNFTISDAVEPFLLSKWGQERFFNFYCPQDPQGPNGRTVTGCVATAMAQLIYYFRFPETGVGSYTYEDANYGTLTANFGETTYDYAAMTDVPKYINLATSTLIHHCGVAVDMVYGPDGSGMYNHKAAYALRNYFKFSPQTEYLFRDSTNINWDSLIVSYLNKKIPLYYAGWSEPNIMGHAFICDGYEQVEDEYFFHFNFGWDGSYDGYFYTNNLIVGGNNFNLAQELIINAYPDTVNYVYPNPAISGTTTLIAESGSFEDGSSPCENYADNVDYTWIIQPDFDSIKNIKLNIRYDIAEQDTLFIIFNNETIENQIITNETSSNSWTFNGDKITIRFKTDQGTTKNGFSASYTSTFPSYCNGIVYTEPNGIIEDGSGNNSYNNFTNCNYLIYVENATSITLDFSKFETEPDKDFLRIYDRQSGYVLLETLSGTLEQTLYTFNSNVINLEFLTDELNTFDGWEVSYSSSNAVEEFENKLNNIVLYPNPTSNDLHILNCPPQTESIKIFNCTGKIVKGLKINDYQTEINVSDLPSGFYFIEIVSQEGSITKKFVKQ